MPVFFKKYVQTVNKNRETGLSTCENYDKVKKENPQAPFEVKLDDR